MKIVSKILEEVQTGDYSKVEPLLHFIRSRGDIAESIDEAWEEETSESLNPTNKRTVLKVIKANKREEDFSDDKLRTSVENAIKSANKDRYTLADTVLKEIKSYTKGKECVLTKDLKNEVIKILASKDSSEVARAYMLYVKDDRKLEQRRESKVYTPEPIDPSICNT